MEDKHLLDKDRTENFSAHICLMDWIKEIQPRAEKTCSRRSQGPGLWKLLWLPHHRPLRVELEKVQGLQNFFWLLTSETVAWLIIVINTSGKQQNFAKVFQICTLSDLKVGEILQSDAIKLRGFATLVLSHFCPKKQCAGTTISLFYSNSDIKLIWSLVQFGKLSYKNRSSNQDTSACKEQEFLQGKHILHISQVSLRIIPGYYNLFLFLKFIHQFFQIMTLNTTEVKINGQTVLKAETYTVRQNRTLTLL